jgi:O-antigen ligase
MAPASDNVYSLTTASPGRFCFASSPPTRSSGSAPPTTICTPLTRSAATRSAASLSHNNYLDVALQTGGLGLLCLLAFAAACVAAGLRLRRHTGDGFDRGFACACLGGLAGTLLAAMIGDWWLPFVYNVTLHGLRASVLGWTFLGAMLARARDT